MGMLAAAYPTKLRFKLIMRRRTPICSNTHSAYNLRRVHQPPPLVAMLLFAVHRLSAITLQQQVVLGGELRPSHALQLLVCKGLCSDEQQLMSSSTTHHTSTAPAVLQRSMLLKGKRASSRLCDVQHCGVQGCLFKPGSIVLCQLQQTVTRYACTPHTSTLLLKIE